jgi:uncharacterized protein YigE (DUF2233 family)
VEAPANWRVIHEEATGMSALASWRQLRVIGDEGEVTVSLVRFDDRHATLRVVDQPQSWTLGDTLGDSMRQAGAIAGVNGGYFQPDFTPLGLVITDGRRMGQFTRSSLVSGMVRVIQGRPALVWNSESSCAEAASDLLQAGPRLLSGGQPITGLNASKTAARSFVATDGENGWLIGVTSSVSLHGLAELLATPGLVSGLRLDRALNLDGGRSTAFFARLNDGREINKPSWSTVRNYLALVPRTQRH